MAQELISKHFENLLSKKLRNLGKDVRGMEEILDNLDALANEKIEFGDEKTRWLDLNTKKMLAKMLDPNCRIVVPEAEIKRDKECVAVTAYFYWSGQEYYAGRGYAKRNITDLIRGQADAQKVEAEFEALVMGAAITRALTDAGIGLELYADGFDELFTQVELNEAEDLLDKKKEAMSKAVPEVPTLKERREQKKSSKAETTTANADYAASTARQITTPIKEPNEEPVQMSISFPEREMDLGEAKLVIADCGNFAGQPLGVIYSSRPNNILWLYKNSPNVEVKSAANAIIESDETLKAKK